MSQIINMVNNKSSRSSKKNLKRNKNINLKERLAKRNHYHLINMNMI